MSDIREYKKDFDGWIEQIRVFSSKRIWNKLAELDKKDFRKAGRGLKILFALPAEAGRSWLMPI